MVDLVVSPGWEYDIFSCDRIHSRSTPGKFSSTSRDQWRGGYLLAGGGGGGGGGALACFGAPPPPPPPRSPF